MLVFCLYFCFWLLLWHGLKPKKNVWATAITDLQSARVCYLAQCPPDDEGRSFSLYTFAQSLGRSQSFNVSFLFDLCSQKFRQENEKYHKRTYHKQYFMLRMSLVQSFAFILCLCLYKNGVYNIFLLYIHGFFSAASLVCLEFLMPSLGVQNPIKIAEVVFLKDTWSRNSLMQKLIKKERLWGYGLTREKHSMIEMLEWDSHQSWLHAWKSYEGVYCLFELLCFGFTSICLLLTGAPFQFDFQK